MPSRDKTQRRSFKHPPLLIRLALWVTAFLIIIPALSVLAIHIPSVQQAILFRIINRIEKTTHYRIEIGSYKWWPLSRLDLEKVKLKTGGNTIFDCGEVRFDYGLLIAFPFINPKKIYMAKPYLQVERGEDGKWLLPGTGEGGEGGGNTTARRSLLLSVPMPTLHVVSGTIEGRQRGNVVLSIKDATGLIHLKRISGPDGVRIGVDLDNLRAQIDSAFGVARPRLWKTPPWCCRPCEPQKNRWWGLRSGILSRLLSRHVSAVPSAGEDGTAGSERG